MVCQQKWLTAFAACREQTPTHTRREAATERAAREREERIARAMQESEELRDKKSKAEDREMVRIGTTDARSDQGALLQTPWHGDQTPWHGDQTPWHGDIGFGLRHKSFYPSGRVAPGYEP